MKIDRQNIINHELIGLHAKVIKSTNKNTVGLGGRIIDESRNLFTLESRGREKKAAKFGNTFEFWLSDSDKVIIDGGLVVGRPEDRVAKRLRKWHNR